eukprot:TRINITY_DN3002_c0_g1_i1.p1 TRINITY_DN3002_c0_g1~~TRINITY_DN3002_c0_g1_i1.p1  ORF type:complete len:246 (-),score=43.78 TRINITY_DN3002_c0_g1_i1:615-1352(-)
MASKIALVTGGNKGIGFAICKQLAAFAEIQVVLGSRDEGRGSEAVQKLSELGFKNVESVQLDVSDDASIEKAIQSVLSKHKKIDILVNNAGIVGETWGKSFLETNFKDIEKVYRTNTLGPLRLCQLVVPVMRENKYGRIVNVSSGAGQLSDMNGKTVPYRLSKVSLNAITRIVHDENKDHNILINSMCPGAIPTDIAGIKPGTPLPTGINWKTPDQGADTAVWLATLPDDGPRGLFWRERKQLPW